MAVLCPSLELSLAAAKWAGIKQDSRGLTLFLTLPRTPESIHPLCAIIKRKCFSPSWASCELLPVVRRSEAITKSKRVPVVVSASLERERVNDNYVSHCQERLQPSETLAK